MGLIARFIEKSIEVWREVEEEYKKDMDKYNKSYEVSSEKYSGMSNEQLRREQEKLKNNCTIDPKYAGRVSGVLAFKCSR